MLICTSQWLVMLSTEFLSLIDYVETHINISTYKFLVLHILFHMHAVVLDDISRQAQLTSALQLEHFLWM
ncbi:hypothetical protein EV44_g3855 [Erysiphe necator]|uniref:Uncharacterized protein n=1 Tax=Uncinula necator TaxID=52586 RepID=A0A0B1NUG6_UNCNE|nr:hypothetical protein EV44_g3855 [Erysiphe necator]